MSAPTTPAFEAPSEAVRTAFMAWAHGELACQYAEPCPDEVMDHLIDQMATAMEKLIDTPAASAADVLLKVFPFLLVEAFEPKRGDNPLCPRAVSELGIWNERLLRVLRDLEAACPELAWALHRPPVRGREA